MNIVTIKRVLEVVFDLPPKIMPGEYSYKEGYQEWVVDDDYLIYKQKGKFCLDSLVYRSVTHIDSPETVTKELGAWRTMQELLNELCNYMARDKVNCILDCIEHDEYEAELVEHIA